MHINIGKAYINNKKKSPEDLVIGFVFLLYVFVKKKLKIIDNVLTRIEEK
jgi:hypothetical protein